MIVKFKSLQNNQGFIRYFENTSWLFGEKILRMIANLFVGIWIARYLGPEQFGLYSYAVSFVGLFSAFATLGLDGIVVRELVKNEREKGDLLGTAFWLRVMGAFGGFIFLAVAINFTSNDEDINILIFIIASATIFQSFNVVDLYFQSKVQSKYVAYANVTSLFLSSLVKIYLILNDAPLVAFAWVVLFDSFVLAMGFIYFFLKKSKLNIQHLTFKRETAVSLLKDSWPLIFSSIVISIYMKIDQVMIQNILGSTEVGQYAAAVKLSEAWYFIPVIIVTSLFPAIINAKKESEILYDTRLQKLYDLMVWMAIAIALPMTFMSDWIVTLLYGSQYNEAGEILMIHIWTGVFVFLGSTSEKYLTAENLAKKSLYKSLFGVIVNVLLNIVLIPEYGIIGAAYATLLGQLSANYLYDFFDKDLHQQLIMKTKSFFPVHIIKRNVK